MASAAVGKLVQLGAVIAGRFDVTIETKTHVEHLRVFGHRQLGHIPVALFAVFPRRDVRTMIKVNEIRHLRHGHPLNGCTAFHGVLQRCQQFAGLSFGDLLVTGPAFCLGGNSGVRAFGRSGMAIQALNAKCDMGLMWELDRLFGRLLGGR